MDQEKEEIEALHDRLVQMRREVSQLQELYDKSLRVFQEACSREGHDFEKESDGDCHSCGYYYTCRRCNYFTR